MIVTQRKRLPTSVSRCQGPRLPSRYQNKETSTAVFHRKAVQLFRRKLSHTLVSTARKSSIRPGCFFAFRRMTLNGSSRRRNPNERLHAHTDAEQAGSTSPYLASHTHTRTRQPEWQASASYLSTDSKNTRSSSESSQAARSKSCIWQQEEREPLPVML